MMRLAVVVACFVAAGCAPSPDATDLAPAPPRRTSVWISGDVPDEATLVRLRQIGVDRVVVPRGRVSLAGPAPVVRLDPSRELPGHLPVAVAYVLEPGSGDFGTAAADGLWHALASDPSGEAAVEIVLDVRLVRPGLDGLLADLAAVSGRPVIPLLSVEQLHTADGLAAARAAGSCVVPLYGRPGSRLRDSDQRATAPLAERLAPLVGTGVRVRAGISLWPVTSPALDRWPDDIDLLTEDDRCEVTTSSALDRTFVFRRPTEWSGRSWTAGDRVAVGWMDAARLDRAIAETTRLMRPELGGWDLATAPPAEAGLGLGREAFERYLAGEGPDPRIEAEIVGSGSSFRVVLRNRSPFASAVSGVGNLVEVVVSGGRLVAEDRGDFDRVAVGSVRSGEWQSTIVSAADAVRYHETYVAPGEEIRTGLVRLTSGRGSARVRWQIVLSTGERVAGVVAP